MYDNLIVLVSEEKTTDQYGDLTLKAAKREIYAELRSIGQTEFYQAQAVGMKPEIKFVIADYMDYKGEKKLEYTDFMGNTEEYSIIRTYQTGSNELEIVCKRGID